MTHCFLCALVVSAHLAAAVGQPGADAKASLGLSKDQEQKLHIQEKSKSTSLKSLHDAQDQLITHLMQAVQSNATESELTSDISDYKTNMGSSGAAELGFWDSLAAFLTPAQEAKVFLKSHPPRNGTAPASSPKQPSPAKPVSTDATMSPPAWKDYFAVTKDQQQKLDETNRTKSLTVKQLREKQDGAIEQLRSKVDANAPDGDVKTAFSDIVEDMGTIQKVEINYWETIAGFLNPTQTAKLLLRQRHRI